MAMERWRPGWSMVPWRPARDFDELERRFEEFFGQPLWLTGERGWMPAVDVFEKDDKFIVKAELPGLKKEDIDVSVTDSTLQIKGEKKSESEVKEKDYYRSERSYGSFYRAVPLPARVNPDKIQADFEDGVLEVTLSKSAASRPKKVTVTARKKMGKATK
jgi:HSP20 family protein